MSTVSSLPAMFDPQKFDKMDPMQNQLCRVCDEPAAGFHFGAFTCEGCKSFFGRTCNNQSVIAECKNNYRCVVDKKNRTSCKACRLRKCLMVGMSKSGSRYGRRSNWFKIHCLMQQKGSSSASTSSCDPPSSVATHSSMSAWASSARKDDLSSDARDSSFGSSSRSPSPLNTSLESLSKKSSLPSPVKRDSLSPAPVSPPSMSSASSLSSMYSSPLSLLSPGSPFPFYKLSPLLAAHNPLLANPLLLSLAGQHHLQQQQQQQQQKSHLDILAEHRELLAKFGAARSAAIAAASVNSPSSPTLSQRSPPVTTTDSPIDLSVKFSATTCILRPQPPSPSSPSSSSPDDEGIEVDIGDKSDNRNILLGNITNSGNTAGAVLDLTVSS